MVERGDSDNELHFSHSLSRAILGSKETTRMSVWNDFALKSPKPSSLAGLGE